MDEEEEPKNQVMRWDRWPATKEGEELISARRRTETEENAKAHLRGGRLFSRTKREGERKVSEAGRQRNENWTSSKRDVRGQKTAAAEKQEQEEKS